MKKTVIIAAFIFPERVDWFLGYLQDNFSITKDKVFCYKNLDDLSKVIITFKFSFDTDKKVNFKQLFPSAIIIHKKGDALYTINALNKLIELEFNLTNGNIDYNNYKLDWSLYQNKFILLNGQDISIFNIQRVF